MVASRERVGRTGMEISPVIGRIHRRLRHEQSLGVVERLPVAYDNEHSTRLGGREAARFVISWAEKP